MFKKKCLFGGGLCLGSSIAIFASISSDVIAQEFTAEARNTLTQIYWRTHAHNIIEETKWKLFKKEIKDKPWFIDKDYDESIKKVIGKAIADCLTNMNEFQDKDKGTEEIITFKNTNPENYDQANWNAVMLYNYVNEATKGKITTTEEILNVCHDRIQQFYRDVKSKKVVSTKEAIKKARDDIDKYDDAFKIYEQLKKCKESFQKYAEEYESLNLYNSLKEGMYHDSYRYTQTFLPWMKNESSTIKTTSFPCGWYLSGGRLYMSAIKENIFILQDQKWELLYEFFWYKTSDIRKKLKDMGLADLLGEGRFCRYYTKDKVIEAFKQVNDRTRAQKDLNRKAARQKSLMSANSLMSINRIKQRSKDDGEKRPYKPKFRF